MKYYVYLSDTKLEMLYGQIYASTDEAREASLGFDIKLLKGELKDSRKLPDTRFSQLDRVLKELRKSELVGDIFSEKPYISGELDMVWASFAYEDNSPITFWGFADERIALGLAGSRYHIVGERRPDGLAHSHSETGGIMAWLMREFGDTSQEVATTAQEVDRYGTSVYIWLAASEIRGTTHRFEFVAKVLDRESRFKPNEGSDHETNVILATPIYVAQVD
jgi:hypothetical protein